MIVFSFAVFLVIEKLVGIYGNCIKCICPSPSELYNVSTIFKSLSAPCSEGYEPQNINIMSLLLYLWIFKVSVDFISRTEKVKRDEWEMLTTQKVTVRMVKEETNTTILPIRAGDKKESKKLSTSIRELDQKSSRWRRIT